MFRLDDDDLVLSLDHVEEHGDFRFLSLRLPHIVSVSSTDDDALAATCHWQGRLLDPKACRPGMVDYNWMGFTARMMGTAWRPDFLAILDVPGYEDLLIVDVWDYTQTDGGDRQVSLGAELMYRQRSVEGPRKPLTLFPPGPLPKWTPPAEPLLCGKRKTARIHFLLGGRKPLDWTDAAKWLQKTLAGRNRCTKLAYALSYATGSFSSRREIADRGGRSWRTNYVGTGFVVGSICGRARSASGIGPSVSASGGLDPHVGGHALGVAQPLRHWQFGRDYGPEFAKTMGFTKGSTPCCTALHYLFVALEPQAFERAIQKWLRAQQKTGWREIDDALAILYSNANNGSMSIANETIDVEDGGTTLS